MKRVYLTFTKTGTFKHKGGCSVDIEDGEGMKEVWAKAHDQIFAEYIAREREYNDEEWTFELLHTEDDNETA